jgi:hypothetical protein
MQKNILIICVWITICILTFSSCRHDESEPIPKNNTISIMLYNQPLDTIKHYTQGKWKLHYSYGGISAHKEMEKHNAYMVLNPTHIIIGNDLTGIVVDTSVVWKREMDIFGDSTFLLSYSWSGYLWPEHLVVSQIKYDTLIINENVYDGITFYYTKQ